MPASAPAPAPPPHPVPFQRFLDAHATRVWRYLAGMVGPVDADDCFQETFIAALRAYPKLRRGSNERAWILTIAHRKALDHISARGRRAVPSDALPEQPHHDPLPGDDPIWARVRELPPKQRAAVTLRYAADLTHAEVATALGTSVEAARRSAHEGLKRLRATADDEGTLR
ncbi:ECF RNA polymerase sigma factor SigE [Paraconexibacter sp. AEG42_29]|uniref:ECF RNA polymerase sigma factor SigE n=1 Tax=Paraconexibacter sp. AEG42_29 TaxID=2997339 RepID=A0AAU7AYS1_9ACTN